MNTYAIKIGDLEPVTVDARNFREAINKIVKDPDEVAIVQSSWDIKDTLVRVGNPHECEPIGKIWRVDG